MVIPQIPRPPRPTLSGFSGYRARIERIQRLVREARARRLAGNVAEAARLEAQAAELERAADVSQPAIAAGAPVEAQPPGIPPTPRERMDIGGWFGSGVIENLLGGGIAAGSAAGSRLQQLGEKGGGLALSAAGMATGLPGSGGSVIPFLRRYEETRKQLEAEEPRGWRFGIEGPTSEAFRQTDFPTGVKGALEIVSTGPFDLLPLGPVAKGARAGLKAGVAGVKAARGITGLAEKAPKVAKAAAPAPSIAEAVAAAPKTAKFFKPPLTTNEILSSTDRLTSLFKPVEEVFQTPRSVTRITIGETPSPPSPRRGALRWTAEKVGGLGAVVDPDDTVGVAFIVHSTLEDQAGGLIAKTFAPFEQRWPGLFKISKAGDVQDIGIKLEERTPKGKLIATKVSQVFEDAFDTGISEGGISTLDRLPNGLLKNPKWGYEFTQEQVNFIDDFQRLVGESGGFMKAGGVKVGETVLEGAGSRYIPRIVIKAARAAARGVRENRALGRKQSNLKTRFYQGQEIQEGAARGENYESDILAVGRALVGGAYRAVRDKQLSDMLAPVVKRYEPTAATRKLVFSGLKQVRATGKMSDALLKRIRRVDDTIADDIEAILAIGDKTDRAIALDALTGNLNRGILSKTAIEGVELAIDSPVFKKGEFFDEATGKRILEQIRGPGGTLEAAAAVADLGRTAAASVDFSGIFIQGIALLAESPARWAAGIPKMFRVFAKPGKYSEILVANHEHLEKLPRLALAGRNELHAGIGPQGLLARGLRGADRTMRLEGKGPGKAILNVFSRFDTAFTFYGDYARIELSKALLPIAEEAARRGNVRAIDDMVDMVNKMTGTFSPGALVIPPTQQAIERAFIFFAPRYTRAALAVVKAAVTPGSGLQGELARRSLTRMAAGGLGMYWATATALGQEPKLNPLPRHQGGDGADFLTIQIGGDRIGIGSFWTSFVRFVAQVGSDPAFRGDISDSPLLFQSTEPGGRSVPDRIGDNQIFRWLRSRTSIPSGFAWDIATGSDFIGNPIEGAPDIARHLGEQHLPFFLENALIGRPHRAGPAATAGEIFGLRSFPLSLSRRRNQLQDMLAWQEHGDLWENLNDLQQDRLRNTQRGGNFEELSNLTDQSRRDRVVRGREIDAQVEDFFTERDLIQGVWQRKVGESYGLVQSNAPGRDLPWLRGKVANHSLARRDANDRLDSNPKFEPVREWLDAIDKLPGRHPDRPEDIAYGQYIQNVIVDPALEPEGGDFDFREQKKRIQAFRIAWGSQVHDYVLARFSEGKGIPPIIQELYGGREKYKWYWGDPDDELSVTGAVIAARSDSQLVKNLYDQWMTADLNEKAELKERHPNLKAVISMRDRVRKRLREQDPELDAFLFRWGYTGTLVAGQNQFPSARDVIRHPLPVNDFRFWEEFL